MDFTPVITIQIQGLFCCHIGPARTTSIGFDIHGIPVHRQEFICFRHASVIDRKFHGFPGASFGCHNHHRACRTFLLRLSCYITIVQTKSLRQFTSFLQCEGCILPAGYCVAVGSVNTIPEQIAIIRLPHLQIRDIPKLTVRKPEYCRFLPFKGHFGKQIPSFIAKPVSIV